LDQRSRKLKPRPEGYQLAGEDFSTTGTMKPFLRSVNNYEPIQRKSGPPGTLDLIYAYPNKLIYEGLTETHPHVRKRKSFSHF